MLRLSAFKGNIKLILLLILDMYFNHRKIIETMELEAIQRMLQNYQRIFGCCVHVYRAPYFPPIKKIVIWLENVVTFISHSRCLLTFVFVIQCEGLIYF